MIAVFMFLFVWLHLIGIEDGLSKVFGVYFSEFFIFLHEIVFGSKILPSSYD